MSCRTTHACESSDWQARCGRSTDMHPTAVAGFLLTPQPELRTEGQSRTVLDSLRSGGAVEPVLRLIEVAGRPTER
jgi:hypothetical protein